MLSVNRYVVARESNIVRVDFSREPDPPAPCFPGANGLRLIHNKTEGAEAAVEMSSMPRGMIGDCPFGVQRALA